MQTNFFKGLSELMGDKQNVRLTVSKVGESLTILVVKDNKNITFNGTPEEIDDAIMDHLRIAKVEKQEFSVTVSESPESPESPEETKERKCRVCGCTEENCSQCIEKTGGPCHWVEEDLCSACVESKAEDSNPNVENPDVKDSINNETPSSEEVAAKEPVEKVQEEKQEEIKDFKYYMEQGKAAFEKKKWQDAMDFFMQAINTAPKGNTSARMEYEKAAKWKKATDEL